MAAGIAGLVIFVYRNRILGEQFYTVSDTVGVKSNIDGTSYRVHLQHGNSDEAADTLARVNKKLIRLMAHLKTKYPLSRSAEAPARCSAVHNILMRYNPDNLVENSPLDPSGDTAFTLDKGALLALCIRERDPSLKKCLKHGCSGVDPRKMILHDEKITTFVAIHELTHIAIDALDHPPKFWQTFKFLLNEADECGVLRDIPYDRNPVTYCGLFVNYVPNHDPDLPDIN
jgi:hypothetical protein